MIWTRISLMLPQRNMFFTFFYFLVFWADVFQVLVLSYHIFPIGSVVSIVVRRDLPVGVNERITLSHAGHGDDIPFPSLNAPVLDRHFRFDCRVVSWNMLRPVFHSYGSAAWTVCVSVKLERETDFFHVHTILFIRLACSHVLPFFVSNSFQWLCLYSCTQVQTKT